MDWSFDGLFVVLIHKGGTPVFILYLFILIQLMPGGVIILTRLGIPVQMTSPDRPNFNDVDLLCFEGISVEGGMLSVSCHPTQHYAVLCDGYPFAEYLCCLLNRDACNI